VSAIDRNGHQLGSPASWDHVVPARTVVLAPGATYAAFGLETCSHTGPVYLGVEPVLAGVGTVSG
jgi:hypothetical protein